MEHLQRHPTISQTEFLARLMSAIVWFSGADGGG
jgi:hypothetical protein